MLSRKVSRKNMTQRWSWLFKENSKPQDLIVIVHTDGFATKHQSGWGFTVKQGVIIIHEHNGPNLRHNNRNRNKGNCHANRVVSKSNYHKWLLSLQNLGAKERGCSSVGRAWNQHAAEAGSIPWCTTGFFSPSQLSEQTHFWRPYNPRVQSHALTSVCTLMIPNIGSHTFDQIQENTARTVRNG